MIHCSPASEPPISRWIAGSATLTMVDVELDNEESQADGQQGHPPSVRSGCQVEGRDASGGLRLGLRHGGFPPGARLGGQLTTLPGKHFDTRQIVPGEGIRPGGSLWPAVPSGSWARWRRPGAFAAARPRCELSARPWTTPHRDGRRSCSSRARQGSASRACSPRRTRRRVSVACRSLRAGPRSLSSPARSASWRPSSAVPGQRPTRAALPSPGCWPARALATRDRSPSAATPDCGSARSMPSPTWWRISRWPGRCCSAWMTCSGPIRPAC